MSNISKEEKISRMENLSQSSDDWEQERRVVELDVLAKGLSACTKCGLPLQLTHTQRIITCGLGSLIKVLHDVLLIDKCL